MRSRVSAARWRRTGLSYRRRARVCSAAVTASGVTVSRRHDRERLPAAHSRGRCQLGPVEVDVPFREAREDLVERDAAFEPGQRGAETEVDAVPEREVLVDVPVDVEAIRVLVAAVVAVG